MDEDDDLYDDDDDDDAGFYVGNHVVLIWIGEARAVFSV